MKIIINGKFIDVENAEMANYEGIIKVAGMPYRRDYTVTFVHPNKKGILFYSTGAIGSPSCPPVFLLEGMIFNITLTGAA